MLLEPIVFRAVPGDIELASANAETLSALGFELEAYGEDRLVLRSLPSDTEPADAPSMIEELFEKLRRGAGLSPEAALDEMLHTIACRAAIKAGKTAGSDELRRLAESVLSGSIKYCPHGRPVSVTLTKKQLDKEFSRIV